VFGILTANITQSLLFTNKSLMMFAIIVNVIIAFLLTSGSFSIFYNAIRIIFNMLFTKQNVTTPPELDMKE
jgi:hypothetical protein